MKPDEFQLAKRMEDEGWEYTGVNDAGDLVFTRLLFGVIFAANVRQDR